MKSNIFQQIQEIYDFSVIEELANCCLKQKKRIIDKEWEGIYKKKCPNQYLPLQEFVKEIDSKNLLILSNDEKLENWVYEYPSNATISYILNEAKDRKLCIPKKVSEMVCEACACNGCPYLKEHLGYDCNKCAKEMSYTGYEGYCDE